MKSFRLLQSHLQVLSYNDLKINGCFERAFATLFEQDVQTFTGIMLLNLDQLEKQLEKMNFKEMILYFAKYTRIEVKQFRETLLLHIVKRGVRLLIECKALDASLVVTECSGTKSDKHDSSSSSRTYITHVVDADIRPVNDQVPFINDLKAQLQAKTTLICNLKNQIKSVKDASNEAKVKNDIDVIETINIELEHSVAKLLAANEQLHKENEHLKQTYKELYDSIKKTRVQNKDNSDSLISQINQKSVKNADLKAQIQEKVFANAALKNELRKLKGNSVDTKFAKPSILGKPVLQPLRNQSVVRQPNAFKSERPNFPKPRFASQVDVNNFLSKPVTPHYLPKVREYVLAKTHHVIAPGSSRNSQKVSYGSNDMAHNHYLEEAMEKAQERNRNSKPCVMHTTSLQNTTNGSKPNSRSNNQISRSLSVSKSSCGMSNGVSLVDHSRNSEMNSRAKVQSPKTKNINKFIEPKSHTQKPGRQIAIGQRFSPKKSSAVHEKSNTPRSCLSEPPNGSDDDITNSYEYDQTVNVSAGTTNLSAGLVQNLVSSTPYVPSKKNYEILFQPLFDEYFNLPPRAVSLDPVVVAAQELLIQSVQLRQLPSIKMYHLLVPHQQIRKFNLKSFFKVLKK
ncbi:hypothetical protein Tco_1219870 [Tanacetum coccineum]